MNKKLAIYNICFLGITLALAIVLSSFCQIRLYGDIRLDLSYLLITVICYAYGAIIGAAFATGVAFFNSLFFSSYGISFSWMAANAIIGLAVGAMLHLSCGKKREYMFFDIFVIVLSCALGLLITKTAIECWLYEIPFGIKIVKNAVAFGVDTALMIVGYFALIPLLKLDNKKLL